MCKFYRVEYKLNQDLRLYLVNERFPYSKINKEKQTCLNMLQFQQKKTDTVNKFQFLLF